MIFFIKNQLIVYNNKEYLRNPNSYPRIILKYFEEYDRVQDCHKSVLGYVLGQIFVRIILGCLMNNPPDLYSFKNSRINLKQSNCRLIKKHEYSCNLQNVSKTNRCTVCPETLILALTTQTQNTNFFPAYILCIPYRNKFCKLIFNDKCFV